MASIAVTHSYSLAEPSAAGTALQRNVLAALESSTRELSRRLGWLP